MRPAIEGVLDAFQTHPLVGLGDWHGLAQELDFYAALIRHPRFAAEVGHVVVEFGGAAHQSVIDRYVAGEPVPYVELRKVWTDTVGWAPMPVSLGFMNVFAQVRATNMALPAEQKIRVWLGEPPVDWSQIKSRADLDKLAVLRESHPAEVICREILGRNQKALVIYGGAHLLRGRDAIRPAEAAQPGSEVALRRLLIGLAEGSPPYDAMVPAFAETTRFAAAWHQRTTAPYGPLQTMTFRGLDPMGLDVFDVTFANEEVQAAIVLDAGGKIERAYFRPLDTVRPMLVDEVEAERPDAFFIVLPYVGYMDEAGCQRFEAAVGAAPALLRAPDFLQALVAAGHREDGPLSHGDAILFVGRRADLTHSPMIPDLYLDEDYRRELSRRYEIMVGAPLSAVTVVQPVTPRKFAP